MTGVQSGRQEDEMNSLTRLSLAVVFAGLAATPFATAQANDKQPTIDSTKESLKDSVHQILEDKRAAQMACPVLLQAQHAPDGSMRRVKGEAPHEGVGQQLQLTVTNSKMAAISSVHLAVHGWSGATRVLPTRKADESDASKTVDLTLKIGPLKTADADVWVSGLNSVNAIDLISIDYTDGSSWKPKGDGCHFIPDGVMLISSK